MTEQEGRSQLFTITLKPSEKAALAVLAEENGATMSGNIRKLITGTAQGTRNQETNHQVTNIEDHSEDDALVGLETYNWESLPLVLNLWPTTAKVLGVGRYVVYELARQGPPNGLPVIRVGRHIRVSRDALRAWLEESAAGGQRSRPRG